MRRTVNLTIVLILPRWIESPIVPFFIDSLKIGYWGETSFGIASRFFEKLLLDKSQLLAWIEVTSWLHSAGLIRSVPPRPGSLGDDWVCLFGLMVTGNDSMELMFDRLVEGMHNNSFLMRSVVIFLTSSADASISAASSTGHPEGANPGDLKM